MKRRQASSVIEAQCRKSISAKDEHLPTEEEEEEEGVEEEEEDERIPSSMAQWHHGVTIVSE